MSVWHMPVATMRTSTSSARGVSTLSVSILNGPPLLRTTAALIVRACAADVLVISAHIFSYDDGQSPRRWRRGLRKPLCACAFAGVLVWLLEFQHEIVDRY